MKLKYLLFGGLAVLLYFFLTKKKEATTQSNTPITAETEKGTQQLLKPVEVVTPVENVAPVEPLTPVVQLEQSKQTEATIKVTEQAVVKETVLAAKDNLLNPTEQNAAILAAKEFELEQVRLELQAATEAKQAAAKLAVAEAKEAAYRAEQEAYFAEFARQSYAAEMAEMEKEAAARIAASKTNTMVVSGIATEQKTYTPITTDLERSITIPNTQTSTISVSTVGEGITPIVKASTGNLTKSKA